MESRTVRRFAYLVLNFAQEMLALQLELYGALRLPLLRVLDMASAELGAPAQRKVCIIADILLLLKNKCCILLLK